MCSTCEDRPHCYWCGERVARQLPGMTDAALVGRVYCTLVCAAYSALWQDQCEGLVWCGGCQQWHTTARPCGTVEPIRIDALTGGGQCLTR